MNECGDENLAHVREVGNEAGRGICALTWEMRQGAVYVRDVGNEARRGIFA